MKLKNFMYKTFKCLAYLKNTIEYKKKKLNK